MPVWVELPTPSCLPYAVEFDATYYWQVVAKDGYGEETAGPVWSFVL